LEQWLRKREKESSLPLGKKEPNAGLQSGVPVQNLTTQLFLLAIIKRNNTWQLSLSICFSFKNKTRPKITRLNTHTYALRHTHTHMEREREGTSVDVPFHFLF